MTRQKPASLSAEFVAKGSAQPVSAQASLSPPRAELRPAPVATQTSRRDVLLPTKALTVKVDVHTYDKLRAHGMVSGGKTNQAIFIEALRLYFDKYGIT